MRKTTNPVKEIQDLLKLEESAPSKGVAGVYWRLPNGDLHRKYGPAKDRIDGHKEWWLNGVKQTSPKSENT